MKKFIVITVASLFSGYSFANELQMLEPRKISNLPVVNSTIEKPDVYDENYKHRGQPKVTPASIEKEKAKSKEPINILSSLDVTQNGDRCAALNNTSSKDALDLFSVVNLAMCNDYSVRDFWLQLRQYELIEKDSYSAYYPQVSVVTNYGHASSKYRYPAESMKYKEDVKTEGSKNSLTNQVELNWLLYDFGKREANVKKAKGDYLANKMLVRSELQDVVLKTAQKYFSVLASKSYLRAAKNNENSARENYEVSRAKRSGGVGVLSDELQARNSYLSYQYNRTTYERELKNAMGELANTIGYPISSEIKLKDSDLEVPAKFTMKNVDELMEKALIQHPKLLAAKQQILSSEATLNSAKSDMLPTIYFSGSANLEELKSRKNSTNISGYKNDIYSYDRMSGSNLGLTIRIPLFSGFSKYHQVLNAKNALDVAKNRYKLQEKEIMLYVWKAYQNLKTATENVKVAKTLLANAKQAHSLSTGRYQSGVGSILELLNTQGNLSQAEIQNVEASVEWHIARLTLISGLGQLDLGAVKEESIVSK